MTQEERTCKKCGATKPLSDFRKQREYRAYTCKTCDNAYGNNRYHNNPRQKAIQKWHTHKQRTPNSVDQESFVGFVLATTCCDYCGDPLTPEQAHIDHRVPVSAGGVTSLENLARTCRFCNNAKGLASEAEYLAWLGRRAGQQNMVLTTTEVIKVS